MAGDRRFLSRSDFTPFRTDSGLLGPSISGSCSRGLRALGPANASSARQKASWRVPLRRVECPNRFGGIMSHLESAYGQRLSFNSPLLPGEDIETLLHDD